MCCGKYPHFWTGIYSCATNSNKSVDNQLQTQNGENLITKGQSRTADTEKGLAILAEADKALERMQAMITSVDKEILDTAKDFDRDNRKNKKRYDRGERRMLDEYLQDVRKSRKFLEENDMEFTKRVVTLTFTPGQVPRMIKMCNVISDICDKLISSEEYSGMSAMAGLNEEGRYENENSIKYYPFVFETGEHFSLPSTEDNIRDALESTGMFRIGEVIELYN